MRKLVSIFVFSSAIFVGLFTAPVENPTLYEKIYPNFSEKEANLLLGRQVVNKYSSTQKALVGMKYSLNVEEDFIAEKVKLGEKGEVVNISAMPDGYILIIRWDEKDKYGRDMSSYDGRFSSRVFLEFQ